MNMKIIKIAQSELLEGYEEEDQKFIRAYADFFIIGSAWALVIYLIKIGYLKMYF